MPAFGRKAVFSVNPLTAFNYSMRCNMVNGLRLAGSQKIRVRESFCGVAQLSRDENPAAVTLAPTSIRRRTAA